MENSSLLNDFIQELQQCIKEQTSKEATKLRANFNKNKNNQINLIDLINDLVMKTKQSKHQQEVQHHHHHHHQCEHCGQPFTVKQSHDTSSDLQEQILIENDRIDGIP
mgnify:CR=1 FL=1